MPIAINGSGSITGISAGGLPDGVITTDDLASTVPVAKAWVNFNGTGTVAIRASYNVSSITDNNTGDYTVNFTTAMVDANYVGVGACGDDGHYVSGRGMGFASSSGWRIAIKTDGGTYIDQAGVFVAIFR